MTGPIFAIASIPRCGIEPCAARPRVSTSQPDEAAVRDADVEAGRLRDDGRVGGPAPDERLRAEARVLLVGDGGHDHVAAEAAPDRLSPREHDRGEARLHVVGAAPVEATVLHARLERPFHARDADRVRVGHQQQRPAATRPPRHGDGVRAAGRRLLERRLQARRLEPLGDAPSDPPLSGAPRNEDGVDRFDGDELRQEGLGLSHPRLQRAAVQPSAAAASGRRYTASDEFVL